ncbi:hypothetical protein GCM10009839_10100 [Catenulispora yoronensis]|uniref:S1 motif domain-containing protein n=1 Tax=Catenulispora yoronensis TaxID=450799 RepID=A0ABN2TPE1_9ACTN
MLPYSYRITKYDPADRNEHGHYIGDQEPVSDHGPIEAAYLQTVAAFAASTGVTSVAIREPGLVSSFVHFGLEPVAEGHGLTGLFPSDLAGFHDGAEVPVGLGLELVRAMLRDSGVFCSLEVEDRFAVHIGWDQYMYISSAEPCHDAVARAAELGLFPEAVDASPYEGAFEEPGEQRPADADFWAHLRRTLLHREAAILEESHLQNVSRWHRLSSDNLDTVRAGLAPRARLTVWPDLSRDVAVDVTVAATLAELSEDDIVEVVWEDQDGRIVSAIVDDSEFAELSTRLAQARAIAVLPLAEDDRHPLFAAVLPDPDGVLRARWRTVQTDSDRAWAVMKTLRRGQRVTGTVVKIATFGVTFVDIGGVTAMINLPELSWRPFHDPAEVVKEGQVITAEILDVDMDREQVPLSLRAVQPDPLQQLARQAGLADQAGSAGLTVTGTVTKLVPIGAFVRIEDRLDGFVGLLPTDQAGGLQVGEQVVVRIARIDVERRQIFLARDADSDLH